MISIFESPFSKLIVIVLEFEFFIISVYALAYDVRNTVRSQINPIQCIFYILAIDYE